MPRKTNSGNRSRVVKKNTSSSKKKVQVQAPVQTEQSVQTEQPVQTEQLVKRRSNTLPVELESELKFKNELQHLRDEVVRQTSALKSLKLSLKKLESSYNSDINRVYKSRRRKTGPLKPTGFVKALALPKDLAELINVSAGTEMSMPEYTKRFYRMLQEKGLLYDKDGRVLRADKKIMKVFGLDKKVNESTDYRDKEGFNFFTLQKHIARVNKQSASQSS
jgi:hypothetical protein